MALTQIEKIKEEYTDKYVVVDGKQPELARFSDVVGQVKTVNMSGRALVEFLDYHLSTAWFDIDLDYLKVVDKPEPKVVEKKKPAAKKTAPKKIAAADGEKKLSPLEMARMQSTSGKSAPKKKTSTADILAAARGGAAPAAKSEPKAEAPANPASEKVDRSKMSVADMLAAARGGAAPAAKSEPEPAATPEPVEEEAPAASDAPAGPVDKSSMSIDDMVAYCREKDAE